MSKIYKDFDEWWKDFIHTPIPNEGDDHFLVLSVWEVRQPEIEQLKQRIKELEHYINKTEKFPYIYMTEKFPYQSKTDEELKALYSSAIQARDWFTCDLISSEKYRRGKLLKETSK